MKTMILSMVRMMAAMLLIGLSANTYGYGTYSTGVNDQGNCATCHGAFREGPYVSNGEGITWTDSLHDAHTGNTDVTSNPGSCDSCHGGTGTSGRTVNLMSSADARDGVNAIACMGCHGRLEDANSLSVFGNGWGAGLRQHHELSSNPLAGPGTCGGCHSDNSPASFTPAPENVLPPWYSSVDNTSISMAMDPCSADGQEDFSSNGTGLDNDGDHTSDMLDTDCAPPVPTPGDLDFDGMADILWRNSTTGQNWAYLMNADQIDQSVGINTVAGLDWEIVGNGDYDGDGDADILWRNSSTGQNWMYLIDSGTIDTSVGVNTVADLAWRVVGNGDYDGDGDSDILWRHDTTNQVVMYSMTGASYVATVVDLWDDTKPDATWDVVQSGDFNGDGMSDVLWHNSITGQVVIFLMNGSVISSKPVVVTVSNTDWQIVGSGDYNGDGTADILWRNSSTGQNWMYLINGAAIGTSVGVNTVSDTNWQIVGSGDYDGDGNADILWRNGSTGQNWMYLMTGATIDSSLGVNTVSDSAWEVVNTN